MSRYDVLVAEPDASQRQIIEMLLLVHGCEVTSVIDARETLAYLRDGTPDLIIASITLPQLSGYDISRKARGVRRLRHVPVILTAPEGTNLEDARTEAELAGADLLLLKPLGDKNLGERAVALIRQAAEAREAGQQRRRPESGSRKARSKQVVPAPAHDDKALRRTSVLEPVSSDAPSDSDEVRQLRRVVADLTRENESLRQQLTGTGRATSGGALTIKDLRERLARANELLEEYRRRYPDLEEDDRPGGLAQLFRRRN